MESSIETNKEPQYSVEVVGMEQAEGDYDNGFQAGEVDVISPPSSESLPAYENEPLHDHTNQPSFNPQAFIQREGELLVETYFGQGSLGVTLRRNADTGIVFVFDIVPNSQAVHIDVQPGDELWSVGEYDIGRTPLDKDAWKGLIDFIKESQRPLRMVWVRRPYVPKAPPTAVDPSSREALPMKEVKEAHSYEYIQLEKLLARLVQNKDQKQNFLPAQSTKRPTDWTATLLQEGRHILRQGDLQAILKGSGSRKPTVKRIILLSDMILVTTPQAGNMLSVDHVIEIITCKVRSIGQVFGGERKNITDHGSAGLDASFELLWPGGEMQLMAESKEIREVWVVNIYLAICECVPQESRVLGWRHQYLLGTIHSAVLSRDEGRIRELVSFCEAGLMDYLAIDTPDEDGFTPLHYACMLRMQNIVRILHEATADVTATDRFGFTALHWSAIHLDAASLDMLCSHVFDIDLHDKQGRTPLVLACLEGRNGADKLDPHALRDCLKIMLTHKPDVSYRNSIGETLVHLLAGSWQFEALEQIIEAGVEDMSIAELTSGMTALHYAVLGDLTKALPGEGTRIMNLPSYNNPDQHNTEPTSIDGVETLHTLIKCGAKVQIKDSLGRTALTLLLDPAQADKWALDDLEAAVITLISSGSRMDESNVATIKARFPSINATALQDKWAAIPPIDCSRLDVR
ncbi:hypothetical protein EON64_02315 [archaeon]|nr:MAG: hypothetical protein EON64_02315 [archaeon]